MSVSIIGASLVKKEERQDYFCIIKKIVCKYSNVEDEEKSAELYNCDKTVRSSQGNKKEETPVLGSILKGGISNSDSQYDYYFISNHEGKEIKLDCIREAHDCSNRDHSQYLVDFVDIKTSELKSERKDITDGALTLYYYNLLYRANDYAKYAAGKMWSNKDLDFTEKCVMTGGAYAMGSVAGTAIDFIFALRFMHLPEIKESDYKYECHVSLHYSECHRIGVPPITIHIYPDIKYSLKIGAYGSNRTYHADLEKTDKVTKMPFSFEFFIEYASKKIAINIGKSDEKEVDSETQKGTILYKTINFLVELFTGAANLTGDLKEFVSDTYGIKDRGIGGDLQAIENTYNESGRVLSKSGSWLRGSLSFSPELSAQWRYEIPEDLKHIQRHLEVELGISCKGELTVDLVQLAILALNKTKKATTALALGAAFASGGLAALPGALIKFLVDRVVSWVIKKFTESIHFDLIFIGLVDMQGISYDSLRDKAFEYAVLTIAPEFRIYVGLDYKSSIVIIASVKAEFNIQATALVSTSLIWELKFSVLKGVFGIDSNCTINPFTLKLEYYVGGSYTIYVLSSESKMEGKTKVWKCKEIKTKPSRFDFFKVAPE